MASDMIFNSFDEAGISVRPGTGNVKAHCPKCREDRRNKTDKSLSVNLDEKIWNCHHCGWTGKVGEKKVREYIRPLEADLKLSEKALNWLKNRGLSIYTIQRFKIGESVEFMPQTAKETNCINFKYYKDEKLVNIKYRDGAKNFRMVKGAELVFFNVDAVKDVEVCVITEGEIDAMSVYEAGVYEVCSVPNGASKGNQKLEYLDNCYTFFESAKKIILATDGDQAGISLRNELSRRLGRERCFYVQYPEGCKDANDVLLKYGKDKVKEMLNASVPFPVEGVIRVENIEEELDYHYENGFKGGDHVGYSEFDRLFSFRKGELTTVTGIPGSGKSAWLDQVLVRLSARNGWKHAICSPENQPMTLHISKIASCFIGAPFYRANNSGRMSVQYWDYAKLFINDHFFFYSIQEVDMTLQGVLDKAKELILRFGVDSLVIDPWNMLDHNISTGMNETQFVSKCLTMITNFAKQHEVHVFLVAHPTKIMKDKATGKYEVPNLYNISGSAHFFNKTDNGITVYRDFETNLITVYVQKVRFFFVGRTGFTNFIYDVDSGRYAEDGCVFDSDLRHYLRRIGFEN